MSERNDERNCPCCGRHCPVERLSCERGLAYFNGESGEERGQHGFHKHGEAREGRAFHMHGEPSEQDGSVEGRVLGALRGCGHYLHHSTGENTNAQALLSFLGDKEKEQLAALLEKCLAHWRG